MCCKEFMKEEEETTPVNVFHSYLVESFDIDFIKSFEMDESIKHYCWIHVIVWVNRLL